MSIKTLSNPRSFTRILSSCIIAAYFVYHVCFPVNLGAQITTFYEHGHKIQHFEDEHLTHRDIGKIWKDPEGRLWIVNVGNILCYNGYEFELFQPDELTRMNDARDQFEQVFVDNRDQIWLSSIQAGVVKYEPTSDQYTRFRLDDKAFTDFNTSSIVSDSFDNIWIGYTRGVLRFDAPDFEEIEKVEIKALSSELKPFIDSILNSANTIESLTRVPNNQIVKRSFTLNQDENVLVLAQGELERSERFGVPMKTYNDVGWITNESKEVVWSMDSQKSFHAGGSIENRVHAESIDLPAGDYTLHYRTDDRFAFDDWLHIGGEGQFGATWRYSPPSVGSWWGIQLLRIDKFQESRIEEIVTSFVNERSLSSSNVNVFRDSKGTIWVYGHALQSLKTQENGEFEFITHLNWNITDPNSYWTEIINISDKDSDNLWMIISKTDDLENGVMGLGYFNKNTGQFTEIKTGLTKEQPYNLVKQDPYQNIWLASSRAENLYRIAPPFVGENDMGQVELTAFRFEEMGSTIGRIKTLETDDFNNLWIGTHQQGLFKIDLDAMPFDYKNLRSLFQMDERGLSFLRQDPLGIWWLLTHDLTLIRYDHQHGEIETFADEFKGIPFRYILYMGDLPNDNLLFITEGAFVEYNPISDKAFERKIPGVDWVSARTGRFASRRGFYYNDTLFYIPGHLVDIKNWKLVQDFKPLLEGSRWVATKSQDDGIWLSRSWGELAHLTYDNGLIDTNALHVSFAYNLDILEDSRGKVWIPNNFNLKTLDQEGHELSYFTSQSGIVQPNYFAKIFERNNQIWLFTPMGTSVIDMNSNTVSNPSDLLNISVEDVYQNEKGEFTIIDANGIYFLEDEKIRVDTSFPKVLIQSLAYDTEEGMQKYTSSTQEEVIRFNHNQNDILLEYVGIQYNNPDLTDYSYRLMGLSPAWQDVGQQRTARFLNLSPGKYEFGVRATNANQEWSEPKSLSFIITPPWWNTLWAKTVYVGLVLFIAYSLVRSRINKLKREKEEEKAFSEALIFAQEEERKRIARDLHDGVGQSILLIKKQAEATSQTNQINQELISNTLEEIRSISRDLHPFQLEKFGLTATIKSAIQKVEKSSDLFITSNVDNIDQVLTSKGEINLYRTIQEALNNIVKHSEASAAMVEIVKSTGSIHIQIKDNGIGFEPQNQIQISNSLGLRTMHERISTLGGEIKIEPSKPKGTVVTIHLPFEGQ